MSDPEDASNQIAIELQKAVDVVNNVASTAASHPKKKKKKRAREETDITQEVEEPVKKKSKKKKKKHDDTHEEEEQPAQELVHSHAESSISTSAIDVALPDASEPPRKRKKKDKGKGRAVEDPNPPEGTFEAVQNTEEDRQFLSLVLEVAAKTKSPEGHPSDVQASAAPSPTSIADLPDIPPSPIPYPEHYIPYTHPPAMPYIPPAPGAFDHASQPPPMYPDFSNLALPDLANASSEDIMRGLQHLDMDKIASLVKSLGEMANISLNTPPPFVHNPAPPAPPPVRQVPVRSDAILGRPGKQSKQGKQPKVLPATLPPLPEGEAVNPDHAHMLANTWMNATKLAEMARKESLVYKKGKFSAIEEAQLNAAIENWRSQKGLTKEQLLEVIFAKDKGRDTFWPEITAALHLRPIIAVYHHVRRVYHPMGQQGRWMPAEDDALRKAYAEHGPQWEKISMVVGRASGDCRDRFRNHIENRDKRQNGPWTKEEEDDLTRIVLEMTVQQNKDIDNEVFWGVVSQRMGGRRGRQQCRIKWTDSLSNQFKNRGQKPRWSQMDSYLLVHKVASLNVRDDSEIDWKQLPDDNWNIWSAHQLQRRWKTLKDSVKDSKHMSHAEIMEILRNKKAQSPPPPTASRKKKTKAATSAETIVDSDDDTGSTPVAGSSTGPGTTAGVST